MKISKILTTSALTILCALCASAVAHGEVIGEVLSTDIVAFIDEQPIESFNINDYTYIIAEDLRGYGFSVVWDADARTLSIERDKDADRDFLPMDKVNIKKSEVPFRAHVFDVYSTDIVTFIGGIPANAYNVNGQTLIMIDELSKYGAFSYNDGERCVKIDMAGFDEENILANPANETLTLPCDKEEGKILYNGGVSDGKLNGAGVIHESYEYTYGLQSTEDYYYSGNFKNGEKDGYIYYHGVKTPHNGSDSRVRTYYSLGRYKDGKPDGYCLELVYFYGTELGSRSESKNGFKRIIIPDREYRYGYRVDDEGYTDSHGDIIDYVPTDAGRIAAAYTGSDMSLVVSENGDLYGFGYFYSPYNQMAKDVPVKLDSGISSAYAGYSYGSTVIDKNGKLYYLWDKIQKYKNTDVPVVFGGVKKTLGDLFLTDDGKLYRLNTGYDWTMYDPPTLIAENVVDFSGDMQRHLFLKDDGSVWFMRLNESLSGTEWRDGLDLSTPVKVFDNAKAISSKERNLVIDENNTLWGWSSDFYNTEYENSESVFHTKRPIKIAEDVISTEASSSFIAYIKTDGSLYVCPDYTEPGNETTFGISAETKLLDGVKQFSVRYNVILAVRNDGTLWVWGKNSDGLGLGSVTEAQTPTQITRFSEFIN